MTDKTISAANLSWSLVVATTNREQILPHALRLAAEQTMPPKQIIVVDSSDHWERTRSQVLSELGEQFKAIEWSYLKAAEKSLPVQRNQGIDCVNTEITFLFDDDTLMYPDCAESILRVYEADSGNQIAGVCANTTERAPSDFVINDSAKQTGAIPAIASSGLIGKLIDWVTQHVLLMNVNSLFIPYDGCFPEHGILKLSVPVQSVPLMQGFRMTYRTKIVARERFEPLLRTYAPFEDLDCSYRVSRHGWLVECPTAWVHHFQSSSGRSSRRYVIKVGVLNQALLLRRNATQLSTVKRTFYALMARRLVAETLKDLLSRRWSLPQVRGLVSGILGSRTVFTAKDSQLSSGSTWYQDLLIRS